MSLIDKLNKKDYLSLFSDVKEKQDFSFVKQLKFDNNRRFLLAIGDTKIFVLDI